MICQCLADQSLFASVFGKSRYFAQPCPIIANYLSQHYPEHNQGQRKAKV